MVLAHKGTSPVLGRGKAVFRSRKIGGRAPGRVHRPSKADPVDCANCPLLYQLLAFPGFPGCALSAEIELSWGCSQGDSKNGFSTARWQALMLRWAAVCR